METVQPRNNPASESMTQDNVVKKPVYMPTPDNLSGDESGISDTAGRGAVSATYSGPTGNNGINGTNSEENRSAKFKYPSVSEDLTEAERNQYQ